jgi:hypothetical protein
VADLTAVYPGAARKLLRGIEVIDRSSVLIQDEAVALTAPTEITWRLLTGAQVTLVDARHATLTRNGQRLQAELIEPETASFVTSPATPPTAAEKQTARPRCAARGRADSSG